MSTFELLALDAPASEWGRLAVSLPGWRWMPGMQTGPRREDGEPDGEICLDPWRIRNDGVPGPYADDPAWEAWPDPDDPATAGCLLALLGDSLTRVFWHGINVTVLVNIMPPEGERVFILKHGERGFNQPTLGRACIAAAAALGRWPGGEE